MPLALIGRVNSLSRRKVIEAFAPQANFCERLADIPSIFILVGGKGVSPDFESKLSAQDGFI